METWNAQIVGIIPNMQLPFLTKKDIRFKAL
jgi:hypothetical protein